MSSKTSGLLGGAIAGFVFGGGQFSYLAYLGVAASQLLKQQAGITVTPSLFEGWLASTLISGGLFGALFGLLYGWKYDTIPGRSPALKGLAIAFLLVLLNMEEASLYAKLGPAFLLCFVFVTSLMAVIYGLLLGYLYYRMELYRFRALSTKDLRNSFVSTKPIGTEGQPVAKLRFRQFTMTGLARSRPTKLGLFPSNTDFGPIPLQAMDMSEPTHLSGRLRSKRKASMICSLST
ncbi:MAG: hypothetical protein ACP5UU_00735 [Thermoprotei archaeon]